MPRLTKIPTMPDSLYVYCTVILSKSAILFLRSHRWPCTSPVARTRHYGRTLFTRPGFSSLLPRTGSEQCENAGRGAGTQGELTYAHRLGIPVYLICVIPVEKVSGWLLGCATEVFPNVESFRDFISRNPAARMATEGHS